MRPTDSVQTLETSLEKSAVEKSIETVWRMESARLIGGLVRMVRDVALAEDLAQEALLLALERWKETGIPVKPGAWLMAAAKNRAIDHLRHEQMRTRKRLEPTLSAPMLETSVPIDPETALDERVGDDVLRLILITCHPVLPTDGRVALTLRLVGGLSTDEIARAFLVAEPTIAQRIVRAKRTLSAARVPFEVPKGNDLKARIPSVLEVLYLIFNEGYSATRGDNWIRAELCEDAMRLSRVLTQLLPEEAEVHGLCALLELQASRLRTRVDKHGEPILLLVQDRSRWDWLLISRGLQALEKAESLAEPSGPYTLQAGIAACHARARKAADTDWEKIVALYDGLVTLTQSPVVALNQAVAISMAYGPAQALELVEELAEEPSLQHYHLLPSVQGDLLSRLNRWAEAQKAFEKAASLTENTREQRLLLGRAAACAIKARGVEA